MASVWKPEWTRRNMANAAKHKEMLVETAATLFRRQGYAATGLNEILATSGAPKGSLYYYFPKGKEALGAAAVTLSGRAASNTLLEIKADTRNAGTFISRYCELLGQWMEASDFRSGCPIATVVLETCPQSALVRQAGQAVFSQWLEIVGEVFVRDGYTRQKARSAALLVITSVEGALILARTQASSEPLGAIGKILTTALKP
jgi:TetR/AcrR family transcriptional repressor of lmrAB and yxaGH operons